MVKTYTLSNNIKVVYEYVPFVHSISFGVWVKNGSVNEEKNNNGISHFIEHMLFKGIKNRTAKNIAYEIDAIGGQIDAFTTKEYTCYFTKTLNYHFDTALEILSDMILNSNFNEEDIIKERNVILEEISMYEDSPEDLAHDLLEESVWHNSLLGLPILGEKSTISKFNKNILKEYMTSNYNTDNIVLSFAGNFDENIILPKIEKCFSNIKGKTSQKNKISDIKYSTSFIKKSKDIEQIHLSIGFPSLNISSKDYYTLSIINTIFGDGISSRLFQNLREDKGLAYSIYSYNSSYEQAGLYNIYMALNKNNLENSLIEIKKEINLICEKGISATELKNTKEQIKSSYLLSLENTSNIMHTLGRNLIMLNKIVTQDDFINEIDIITKEDILRVSKDIFTKEKPSLCLVGDFKNINVTNLNNFLD